MTCELPPVERFESDTGVRIYRLPCEAFPQFIAYAYVLLGAGPPTLVDSGSGYGQSNDHLLAGMAAVESQFGERLKPGDIGRIIVTHGHIDHFGGVPRMLELCDAPVGIHVLDRRVLQAYEERVIIATKALRVYLQRAGVAPDFQNNLMAMYGYSKKHVRSMPVGFLLAEGQPLDGLTFIHAPGHCPGQVCIGVGNILLSADHVLEKTTPHQAPESITAYTGLGHYLEALEKVSRVSGFELALGGHEGPIRDVYGRIAQIRDSHHRKLERVRSIVAQLDHPTISEISKAMYASVHGFNILLALEEVGAHVEFLYQTGELAVSNLDEVEREENPAVRYEAA